MAISETIEKLLDQSIVLAMKQKYRNSVELSGWVLQEPKYVTNEKTGVESCSLIIYQIGKTIDGQTFVKSFTAITFTPSMVAKFREMVKGKVCFITCYCTIVWNAKMKNYAFHIGNFEIPCSLDIDLEPPYERVSYETKVD